MNINGSKILVTGGCGLVGSTTIDLLLRDYSPGQHRDPRQPQSRHARQRRRGAQGPACDAGARRHPRRRDRAQGHAGHGRRDPHGHPAHHRVRRRAARSARRHVRRQLQRRSKRRSDAGVKKVRRRILRLDLRPGRQFPTREDHHPYNNRTWYGASKIMLEGLLRSFNDMYELPYVALRYFNVYGPRMDIHGKYTEVLIRWMDRIAAGQPPLILGDGKTTMDFVYIEDVARSNILALAVGRERRSVQRGERRSKPASTTSPPRCCTSWDRSSSPSTGPSARSIRCRAGWRTPPRPSACWAFAPGVASRKACARLVDWWRAQRRWLPDDEVPLIRAVR